jgi:glycosyltransferase involved in cell wall biosynthesis
VVPAYPGQPTAGELEALAAAGKRPRKDYVELARAVDADVVDYDFMQRRAVPFARFVARRAGLVAGQIAEMLLRRPSPRRICAWADRIGLPLALLYKVSRSRRDLVLVSAWLSIPKKAVFLERLHVYSHLGAIINYSSVQMTIAARDLGVPEQKLHLAKQPVDDRFWRPEPTPTEPLLFAVGWEARDYPTLIRAVDGLDVQVHIAMGIAGLSSSKLETSAPRGRTRFGVMKGTFSYEFHQRWLDRVAEEGLPPNVEISQQLSAPELRALYARCRFVVIPLLNVDSDCGVTSITEAMAMGKAVVLSRTRGQADIVEDGVHGVYVEPGDPMALREAIEHLESHPEEAERMGRAGRQAVERHYALDKYVAQVADIIRAAT